MIISSQVEVDGGVGEPKVALFPKSIEVCCYQSEEGQTL